MTVLRRETLTPSRVSFWCPGCNRSHTLAIAPAPHPWDFNGNTERPTFTPSVKETSYHSGSPLICHSWVADGQIEFLEDSSGHTLRGKHPLPHWPNPPSPGFEDFN
jgi:hypothetical protein